MIDLDGYDDSVFKGSIDILHLDPHSRFYQMWMLWKEYVDYFVVGNSHLKKITFFNLLGVILTHKGFGFKKADKVITTRIHYFMFQRSRSGKGEVMKAKSNLVEYLKIPSRYTMHDNTPSCVGTRALSTRGDVKKKNGYLSYLYDYNWDEGSAILRGGKDMDQITDVFQGVMDDPGFVSKGMAWDAVNYPTKTSICAGSYIFREFYDALMTKGFFQRMIVSYKVFSEVEKAEFRRLVPLLKIRYNEGRIQNIMKSFKELCDEIPTDQKVITFDINAVMEFNPRFEMIYNELISGQFVGRTQEILESFGDMVHLLVDKMSSQRAIIDGKTKVTYEDMLVSLPIVKIHIASILELFDYVETGSETVVTKRELMIMNIIRSHPDVSNQKFILDRLDVEKRLGKWDIGKNKTGTLIRNMISRNILKIDLSTGLHVLRIPK